MSKKVKLYDIAELNRETFKKGHFPETIYYLDTGNLTKNKIENLQKLNSLTDEIPSRAQRKVNKDTILYSTVRPNQEHYGFINEEQNDLVVSTGFTTIDIIDSNVKPKYIYYFLTQQHITEYLHGIGMNSVSSYPSISPSDLGKLEVKIPSLPTQTRIAKVLSDLDAKIELNNKINAELEAMAKLIYDYWFVQFDFPISKEQAEAMGKPELEGRGYKSSGGKMVMNEELRRDVPEGWEVKELEKCLDKIVDYRGKTPKKLGYDWSNNSDDIVALSAKHVKGGKLVNLKQANRVDKTLFDIWMKDLLREGDILMTSEAPCGEFFYLVGKTEYCLSQRLFAIRSNNKIVHHSYLYFELSSGNGYSQIQGKMSGSTVFGIRQDELRTVKVLIPEMKMQLAFFEQISKMYLQIRNNEYQNQKLAELRDWLLPMLMNGQVVSTALNNRQSV